MRLILAFILTIALTGVSAFAVVSDAQCASDGNKKLVSDAALSVPQCGTDGNNECAQDENKDLTSLKSLVEEALRNNPEIKAGRARWEASTKRPSQVSTLPNPTIGVRYMNVSFDRLTLGEDDFTEFGIISASQEFPFPAKLSLKGKIAKEEAEAEEEFSEATVKRVLADLKEAYYEWYLANKSIEITSKNKELIEKFVKIAEAKYAVGRGIQQDVIKAQVELLGFVERLELLVQKKEVVEARLRSILGRTPDSPIGKPEEVQKSDLKLSLDELYKLTESESPILLAKKNLIERNDQALQLAKKEYFPDFVVDFEWINRGEFTSDGPFADMWQVRVGFIVPLYFWRKERFGVEEAVSQLVEMKEEYNNANLNLSFDVKDKYITAKTSEKLLDLYSKGIIPQASLSLESAIAGYEVGNVDFLTLLDNLVTLFNYELAYYTQLAEYQKALARIEENIGVVLVE
ncbi:MAG TPA: TolC family protein [Thermodesulfobacteriota bacterium]|nr:TolC family protein [Thermodesulfobacteriota bacterium]